jgi:hypothetical protein
VEISRRLVARRANFLTIGIRAMIWIGSRDFEEDHLEIQGLCIYKASCDAQVVRAELAQGGAWRRSTTRSVVLDTLDGWLEPSNELQSTGMHPNVEIRLIVAGGCCSIGAGQA